MFAGYYQWPRDVEEVIEPARALREGRRPCEDAWEGRSRFDLGVALVGDPDLVFLDEPTTGFDLPRAEPLDLIRALRSLGTTILLTTHYLDEAQQLADRVAQLRNGEIVRQGTWGFIGPGPHGDPVLLRRRVRRGRDPRSDAPSTS